MAPAAGSPRSWAALAVLTGLALAQPVACQRPSGGGSELDPELAADLLSDVWTQVVEPTLADVRADADALEQSTAAWAAAEASGDGTAEQLAAQQAWTELMDSWQRAEVLQIGPAASSLTAIGGLDLRDEIYSWPTTNRCRVDQETVARGFDAGDFFEVQLVNVTGLDALETLLFSPDDENGCPPQVAINANGEFAALGVDGVRQNRADYAASLAAHVVGQVDAIESAWTGGFADDLASAGEDGSSFATQDEALNAVLDALFYLEIASKDRKLAEPLGLIDCGSTDCLHSVETPLAGESNVWIRSNLDGFRLLFTGGEGTGFDDALADVGHGELADRLLAALDEADAAADALTVPIDQAATGDPTQALALHAALAEVAVELKGDVATVLFLQIPEEAAGDND